MSQEMHPLTDQVVQLRKARKSYTQIADHLGIKKTEAKRIYALWAKENVGIEGERISEEEPERLPARAPSHTGPRPRMRVLEAPSEDQIIALSTVVEQEALSALRARISEGDCSARDLIEAVAKIGQRRTLLTGGATSRTESKVETVEPEELAEELEQELGLRLVERDAG